MEHRCLREDVDAFGELAFAIAAVALVVLIREPSFLVAMALIAALRTSGEAARIAASVAFARASVEPGSASLFRGLVVSVVAMAIVL